MVGAKQNRIVNLSLLIPGGQSLKIPVSCVEQGRWSTSSAAFAPSPNVMYAEARAHKTRAVSAHLARDANPRADQGEVWNAVHAKLGRMGSASPTRAMDDAYAHHARRLEDYTRGLAAAPGQVGGVFAINGRVLGLDLFDCEATLRKLFPKLVRSYALDALDHWDEKAPSARPDDAAALVADLARADVREYPSVGLGQTFRLEGQGVFGGALVVGDVPVHLCAFRMNGDDSLRAAGSDMLSFRTRRSRLGPYCID